MKTLSLKVAIGYIAIIALFIGATYYINHQASIFISSNKLEDSIQIRRSSCDQLIELTLESEALGQTAGIGDKTSFNKYTSTITRIDSAITALDSLSSDSSKLLLDSLTNTIHHKALIVTNLYKISNNKDSDKFQKQIEDLIAQYSNTTSTTNTITTIIREQKSVTIESPKKNVMKRIKAVFKPGEIDTTNITNSSSTTSDTVTRSVKKATNLKNDYNRINSNAIQQKVKHINNIRNNVEMLRAEGGELSLKISSLIKYIEHSEQNLRQQAIDKERDIRQKSVMTTIIIAIIATTLAIIFFIIIWRDITRSNRYRRELEEARLKAENLLIAREKLMLTITHDIKAPAGAIKGYAELIENSHQPTLNAEYIQSINNSASHLLNLVSALLDYHKLDFDDIEIANDQFNVASTLEKIATNFTPLAQKKGLSIISQMASSANCYIQCDLFRLRQIIENLLSNAIKFTDNGSVTLMANVISDTLNLTIKDTGRGMSEEEQEVIFEEFTRLKNSTGIEGTGLGLSIVAKITQLLGGEISLSSTPNEGTSFFVSIPITMIDESEIVTPPIEEESVTTSPHSFASNLKIVIIDDDAIQLKYTLSILRSINNNWDITCCQSVGEDFNNAIANNPHLIFSDINMPQINGFDLAKIIRQSLPSTPIIALTANSKIDIKEYTLNGFDDVLAKPYNRQQLIELLNKHIKAPQIDLTPITQFADGDDDTITLLLTTTLEETNKNTEAIANAIASTDKVTTCAIAHKMLPLISMVNAPGINAFEYFNNERGNAEWTETDSQHAQTILESTATLLTALKMRLQK